MLDTSKCRIFLAGGRGHSEIEGFRSYHTFNFGSYQTEAGAPFGPLYVCNDDTLGGGNSCSIVVEEESNLLLIPLVGAVAFSRNQNENMLVESGNFLHVTIAAGSTISIANPYEDALVNFLHLWMKGGSDQNVCYKGSINLDAAPDALSYPSLSNTASDVYGYKLAIGKFKGRTEVVYNITAPQHGLFLFAVQGAFEAQYRLLESRDALAVWGTDAVEIEALSNEAILLLIELPI